MNRQKQLNLGVIGLGKMGLLHCSILNKIPGVKITAICEKKFLLYLYGQKLFPGIKVVNDVFDLGKLGIDAVIISTPIPSHASIIDSVHSLGIRNIFTEKTLGASGNESKKICDLFKNSGGINMVGYMARYAVTFQKAKEIISNSGIGVLTSFNAYAYSSDFIGIENKSYLRGGVIRDLGCHIIDMALWYFGDLHIESTTLQLNQTVNGESAGHIKVKSASGIAGEFDISWCKPGYRIPDYGMSIQGTNGFIEVNNDRLNTNINKKQQTWYRADLNDHVPFMLGASEYYREDFGFIDGIFNHNVPQPDFLAASKVDSFIDIAKSFKNEGSN